MRTSRATQGFTLMEVLLATALLAVLTAASLSIIYWQMRTQAHVAQSSLYMSKLVNTQLLVRKVLRNCSPASLTVNITHDIISFQRDPLPTLPIDLFAAVDGSLKYNSGNGLETILENIVVSFYQHNAFGQAIETPLTPLSADKTNLIKIELTTIGRETRNLFFLVRPRGY